MVHLKAKCPGQEESPGKMLQNGASSSDGKGEQAPILDDSVDEPKDDYKGIQFYR